MRILGFFLFTFAGLVSQMFGVEMTNVYTRCFGGASFAVSHEMIDEYFGVEPGYLMGIGIGYKLNRTRIEIEGSYRHNDLKENRHTDANITLNAGHMSSMALMCNFCGDWQMDFLLNWLHSYAGIGLGIELLREHVDLSIYNFNRDSPFVLSGIEVTNKSTLPCSQIFCGFGIPLTEHSITKIEYRLLNGGENYRSHSIIMNLDWKF